MKSTIMIHKAATSLVMIWLSLGTKSAGLQFGKDHGLGLKPICLRAGKDHGHN